MDIPSSSVETARIIKITLSGINHMILPMLEASYMRAQESMRILHTNPERYKAYYASTILAASRQYFEENMPCDWTLDKSTNRFHILHRDTGLNVRFLHGFRDESQVPPAGHNLTRHKAWCQEELFGNSILQAGRVLRNMNIVIVWSETGGIFTATAYHPISAGKFPNPAGIDLAIPLGMPDSQYLGFEDLHVNLDEENATLLPFDQTVEKIELR